MAEADMILRPGIPLVGAVQPRDARLVEGYVDLERRNQMDDNLRPHVVDTVEGSHEPVSPDDHTGVGDDHLQRYSHCAIPVFNNPHEIIPRCDLRRSPRQTDPRLPERNASPTFDHRPPAPPRPPLYTIARAD